MSKSSAPPENEDRDVATQSQKSPETAQTEVEDRASPAENAPSSPETAQTEVEDRASPAESAPSSPQATPVPEAPLSSEDSTSSLALQTPVSAGSTLSDSPKPSEAPLTDETTVRASKILLVDDEDTFRTALRRQLTLRGYEALDVNNGEDAIKIVRHENPEVIILDQKMPGMDGLQTLQEIKKIRPEVQVLMLTGFGSTESALATGKHGVFAYLEKPCPLKELLTKIEAARQERIYTMNRQEIPPIKRGSLKQWLIGSHNARPGIILLGALLFVALLLLPSPQRMLSLLAMPKSGHPGESIAAYSGYSKMKRGETVASYYSTKAKLYNKLPQEGGKVHKEPLNARQVSFRARVMLAILLLAALFWATGAIPVGMTALLVGVLMYFFGILRPNDVAKAYAKDAVVFILGVLAVSAAVTKTGLDRRIGLLLLGTSTTRARLLFLFSPLLAVTASFLSEHALVAFLAPVLMLGYMGILRAAGLQRDRHLVVMFLLTISFVANIGGPGSPAAGGRNAVMISILSDYGHNITFGQWVKFGLPFVPVMALVIATYFYFVFGRKLKLKEFNVAEIIRRESEKIGKMTRDEYITATVLVLLILLWTTCSSLFGMGGPVILAIVLLNLAGVLRWRDVNNIHWDVVALYGSAAAMGHGLALTGAALWIADAFVNVLPPFLRTGEGLCISASLFTGILTNLMSDGATVAAIGPITVPMATLSGTSPVMVGLATAFASSFAHMFIIGTPNNAIAYNLGKDPETGEQLLTLKDFFVHGTVVLLLSFAVLWLWAFFGYWRWIA